MRCVSLLVEGLLAVSLAISATGTTGQSVPSNEESTNLLRSALDLALPRNNSSAFHLLANVHYFAEGKASEGRYEIQYASPERYRTDMTLGDVQETYIVLDKTFYIAPPASREPLQVSQVRSLVTNPLHQISKIATASQATFVSVGSVTELCVDSQSDYYYALRVCFDPTTKQAVSICLLDRKLNSTDPASVVVAFSDFATVGDQRYPYHLMEHFASSGRADITIEKFEIVDASSFDKHAFVLPDDYFEGCSDGVICFGRCWCTGPKILLDRNPLPPGPPALIK